MGTWNVTSQGGKKPEFVLEVEHYQLDLVGLTSTHSVSTGTKLLDRIWTVFFFIVSQGVRWVWGYSQAPGKHHNAEFTPVDKQVTSLCLRAMGGGTLTVLTVHYLYLCIEQQLGVISLLVEPEWSPAWGSCVGLHCQTGRLQSSHGQ